MTGIIKSLIKDRMFGFIIGEDGIEYFFHRDDVGNDWNELDKGQRVTFIPTPAPKGPRAKDVSKVG